MSRPIIKVLVFIGLLGVFYGFGGFEPPRISRDDYRSSGRMERAWFSTVALYVIGAGVAVWGDKTTGTIHPVSFRSSYLMLGVIAMLAAFFWMRAVKSTQTADSGRPNPLLSRRGQVEKADALRKSGRYAWAFFSTGTSSVAKAMAGQARLRQAYGGASRLDFVLSG